LGFAGGRRLARIGLDPAYVPRAVVRRAVCRGARAAAEMLSRHPLQSVLDLPRPHVTD